ncbi:MAG TPA: MlaD family protein [Ignavibacteria bacterium]|nr:MlaD family protein [Ignavibacteria bacterium]
MDKSKKVKLGFFLGVGLLLFIITMFYLGNKENIFTPTVTLNSIFTDVSGLTAGNNVTYSGINIGTVQSIDIQGINKVRVIMTVQKSVLKYIKKDSQVTINSTSLVGSKAVSISSGSDTAKTAEDGDYLPSNLPIDIGQIMNNLYNSTKQADSIAQELTTIVAKVNSGEGTLGQLINNKSLYNSVDSAFNTFSSYTDQINAVVFKLSGMIDKVSYQINDFTVEVNKITRDIAAITQKMNSNQSVIGTILTDTNFANNIKDIIRQSDEAVRNFERGAFSFQQNMEALKHNFLFKGYFEDMGYWDKTEFEKQVQQKQKEFDQRQQYLDQQQAIIEGLQKKLQELEKRLDEEIQKNSQQK